MPGITEASVGGSTLRTYGQMFVPRTPELVLFESKLRKELRFPLPQEKFYRPGAGEISLEVTFSPGSRPERLPTTTKSPGSSPDKTSTCLGV